MKVCKDKFHFFQHEAVDLGQLTDADVFYKTLEKVKIIMDI